MYIYFAVLVQRIINIWLYRAGWFFRYKADFRRRSGGYG